MNIGRPAKEFREACAERGIMVGRDFPPYENTHARISIGTLEEMQRATAVFAEVLGLVHRRQPTAVKSRRIAAPISHQGPPATRR